MLCEGNLPRYFWVEVVNTACYILKHILIHPILKKTPYELWNEKKSDINYFHMFGCKCFMLNNDNDNQGKIVAKSDEAIFLGYSLHSKAYRVFNKRTLTVEESMHVIFDDTNPSPSRKDECIDNDAGTIQKEMKYMSIQERPIEGEEMVIKDHSDLPIEWRYATSYPKELIIGDPSQGIRTRSAHRTAHD